MGQVPAFFGNSQMQALASAQNKNSYTAFAVEFGICKRQYAVTTSSFGLEVIFNVFASHPGEAKEMAQDAYPGFKVVDVCVASIQ